VGRHDTTPAGDWVDAWTGEPHRAGLHNTATPIDVIPVFRRAVIASPPW